MIPPVPRRLRLVASTAAAIILFLAFFKVPYSRHDAFPLWSGVLEDTHLATTLTGGVDWSEFAYVQYVTDSAYLCNSVMLFEILHQLGSRADKLMMYPSWMNTPAGSDGDLDVNARLLIKARDEYNVRLQPIQVQSRPSSERTWADSFTKLLAFNQTDYRRVLSLDSDSTILQSMDELFLLPSCPIALPRAYWLYPDKQILSSQIMVIEPNATEFGRVMKEINQATGNDYDMEIVNKLYKDHALVLPHRRYDLLSAEFRQDVHVKYLGSEEERWDGPRILAESKFVHFSDWPVPKPWIKMTHQHREESQPKCQEDEEGGESCVDRDLWNGLYEDFARRRERVCG